MNTTPTIKANWLAEPPHGGVVVTHGTVNGIAAVRSVYGGPAWYYDPHRLNLLCRVSELPTLAGELKRLREENATLRSLAANYRAELADRLEEYTLNTRPGSPPRALVDLYDRATAAALGKKERDKAEGTS